jgi:hypothetical protein
MRVDFSGERAMAEAEAVAVSLKLMLYAPSPQSIGPPVRIKLNVPEGVELQLPPEI